MLALLQSYFNSHLLQTSRNQSSGVSRSVDKATVLAMSRDNFEGGQKRCYHNTRIAKERNDETVWSKCMYIQSQSLQLGILRVTVS